jgi:hypothetical protein
MAAISLTVKSGSLKQQQTTACHMTFSWSLEPRYVSLYSFLQCLTPLKEIEIMHLFHPFCPPPAMQCYHAWMTTIGPG